MRTEYFELEGFGGARLPAVLWMPDGATESVLQITHGMTEHIGRYEAFARELTARDFNWITFEAPEKEIRCTARIRYQGKEAACTVRALDGGRAEVRFDEPQRAITAGQAVVLYDGDLVLGGGTICPR